MTHIDPDTLAALERAGITRAEFERMHAAEQRALKEGAHPSGDVRKRRAVQASAPIRKPRTIAAVAAGYWARVGAAA
jgi:hypothetical protein